MVPSGVMKVEEGSDIGGGRPAARWRAPSRGWWGGACRRRVRPALPRWSVS